MRVSSCSTINTATIVINNINDSVQCFIYLRANLTAQWLITL
jgi:hypothetical protein